MTGAAAAARSRPHYALLTATTIALGLATRRFPDALPPLIAANSALAENVEDIHELGGTIGYWLIGLHAAASLFHHYILEDRGLARMGAGT